MDSRSKTVGALRRRMALALLSVPLAAAAQEDADARWEAVAGPSVTLSKEWTGAAFVERLGTLRATGPLAWAPDFALGVVAARSTRRASLDRDVVLAALGARVYVWHTLFVSGQVALLAGRTDALSSAGEFVTSVGWQGGRWTAMVRHISNARLREPNHGETMLLVGVAF
ncbi:acyloxyacyl hydrolase [Dokdonella sp.]|uniref:acyloxyacyl hydrolase n=1 Tax=Dokdonella sp. TaxID=2291710 RepID=UPI0026363C6B|nr:acyloxyacyl hydrolase [Dokdonella sp.]